MRENLDDDTINFEWLRILDPLKYRKEKTNYKTNL
jgi:hypothetical protein